MSKFSSNLAPLMEAMLGYKEALGYSRQSYESGMLNFDRFCVGHFPEETCLTKEIVLKWMEKRPSENVGGLRNRARTIRHFGKYLTAIGMEAYVLPDNFIGGRSAYAPYVFSDSELRAFFSAADRTKPRNNTYFNHIVVPVIFRLIYTCGLRPNEGRELKWQHVNLDTGEILITGTKHHKERIVVMSDDMLTLCKTYDAKRAIFACGNEYFFPNPNGGAYTGNWLLNQYKSCWKRANSKDLHNSLPMVRVYDLRHRFASATLNRWLDEKKDLYAMLPYLRTYMGHSELSATAYYIHLLPENLVKSAGIDWAKLSALIPEVSEWPE